MVTTYKTFNESYKWTLEHSRPRESLSVVSMQDRLNFRPRAFNEFEEIQSTPMGIYLFACLEIIDGPRDVQLDVLILGMLDRSCCLTSQSFVDLSSFCDTVPRFLISGLDTCASKYRHT